MKNWDETYMMQKVPHKEPDKYLIKFVKKYGERFSRILDVGCGAGRHTLYLAQKGYHVHGVDISPSAINITEKLCDEYDVELKVADMTKLPYKDDCFDCIISLYTLQHLTLDNYKTAFSEIKRVLQKKGLFLGIVLSRNDPRCGQGLQVEDFTFKNPDDPHESDVPHRYSDKKEITSIMKGFKFLDLCEDIGISSRTGEKRAHWRFIASKP